MYARGGKGVPQDYAQALVWFRKAADQGYTRRRTTSAGCTPKGKAFRRTTY